jgi:hypothetical protein
MEQLERAASIVEISFIRRHETICNPGVDCGEITLIFMARAKHIFAKEMLIGVNEFIAIFIWNSGDGVILFFIGWSVHGMSDPFWNAKAE